MNLELIINKSKWVVIIDNKKDDKSYWMVNTKNKTLTVHNYDTDRAKYQAWCQYNV